MTTYMLEAKGLAANLWDEAMNVYSYIQNRVPHSSVKGKTPFKAQFGHKPDVSNFRVFRSTTWARIPLDKRKYLQPHSIECMFIGYLEDKKGQKILNIRTKQIFILRSFHFEEPLQDVELVEEETVEIPSRSADHYDDDSGSESYDISYMMYYISENNILGSESDSNVPTHHPKWAKNTLSSTGTNVGNPADSRRTRSDFQRAGIDISCNDSLMYET